jgi:hypothetical protein
MEMPQSYFLFCIFEGVVLIAAGRREGSWQASKRASKQASKPFEERASAVLTIAAAAPAKYAGAR